MNPGDSYKIRDSMEAISGYEAWTAPVECVWKL